MASREHLVEDIQRLMTTAATASAGTRPMPWLAVDLSMAQLKALMVLHARGIVRVGEVAHMLAMSPNATTAVLDRLEEEGLTQRQPDPTDRRAVLVGLTQHGSEWITELLSANVRDFGELLGELTVAELQALHFGMSAVNRVLQRSDAVKPLVAE
ncbi:MAG: MarR family transcriptional regulator [Dehalococcoidia bacterium]|nr:MAG: MarR family transcriptional regulator [Dehalococcoidia bacterium]